MREWRRAAREDGGRPQGGAWSARSGRAGGSGGGADGAGRERRSSAAGEDGRHGRPRRVVGHTTRERHSICCLRARVRRSLVRLRPWGRCRWEGERGGGGGEGGDLEKLADGGRGRLGGEDLERWRRNNWGRGRGRRLGCAGRLCRALRGGEKVHLDGCDDVRDRIGKGAATQRVCEAK